MICDEEEDTERKFYRKTGLKVLSNVKVTSQDFLPENIKDIIWKYNNVASEEEIETSVEEPQLVEEIDEIREETPEIVHEKKKIESVDVIKKPQNVDEPQPSTSSAATAAETSVIRMTRLSSFTVDKKTAPLDSFMRKFGRNSNRLTKQPKKLIVKLKKPLILEREESEEDACDAPAVSIKEEVQAKEELVEDVKQEQVADAESVPERFTVTFLDDVDQEIEVIDQKLIGPDQDPQSILEMEMDTEPTEIKHERLEEQLVIKVETSTADLSSTCSSSSEYSGSPHKMRSMSSAFDDTAGPSRLSSSRRTSNAGPSYLYANDRLRFSPPLSPDGYIQTFGGQRALQQKTWHHDSSRCTPTSSLDENRSRSYTDIDLNKTNSSSLNASNSNSCHELSQKRSVSIDSLNIRTDEKMPARGEISEQESNGEIEPPWHHQVIFIKVSNLLHNH